MKQAVTPKCQENSGSLNALVSASRLLINPSGVALQSHCVTVIFCNAGRRKPPWAHERSLLVESSKRTNGCCTVTLRALEEFPIPRKLLGGLVSLASCQELPTNVSLAKSGAPQGPWGSCSSWGRLRGTVAKWQSRCAVCPRRCPSFQTGKCENAPEDAWFTTSQSPRVFFLE